MDKTPSYANRPAFLRRAYDTFSAARYIHLIRHPYAAVSSLLELTRDYMDIQNATWLQAERFWVTTNRSCDEFMAFIRKEERGGATLSMHLCYEDFVRDPAGCTRSICALLEIEWVAGMANPYETSAVESFQGLFDQVVSDPKLLKRKTIEGSQAEKWRIVVLPQPLLDATKELPRAHAYELLPGESPELRWLSRPEGGVSRPVVFIHDFTGLLWGFRALAKLFVDSGPLGICGSVRLLEGCACTQDLAVRYVELLPLSLWKRAEPIRLVAYSRGGRIAYWMACLLEAQGRAAELVLLDGRVAGDEGYPPHTGGMEPLIAEEIRSQMKQMKTSGRAARSPDIESPDIESEMSVGAGGLPNMVMLRSAPASMKFAALKRSRQFKVLIAMLADAGEETCETAVRLIELPDTIATPMGPFRGPAMLVSTQATADVGVPEVVRGRIPQVTLELAPGDHFSFLIQHAAHVFKLLSSWPTAAAAEEAGSGGE